MGEAALLDGRLRNASVVALSAVRVLRIGYDEMTALLERRPGLRSVVQREHDSHALPAQVPHD